MSDTPIFDRLAAARGYYRMIGRQPNGTTRSGLGFFARVVSAPETSYQPDPHLDGPLPLIGAQMPEEIVQSDEEDEIYIAPSPKKVFVLHTVASDRSTPLVISDIDPETADKPTHEFPRVSITGFVDKKIEGGLYDYLKASMREVEAQYPSGGTEPQKGFRGLLDGILQDARQELPYTIERVMSAEGMPFQIVLAETTIRGENMVDNPEFIDAILDQLIEQAKQNYPRHFPVSVDVLSPMDFEEDGYTFRLKGVEGALPVYQPMFKGDTREDSVGSDVFTQVRVESMTQLAQSPSEDPSPQYLFALPKPLFEMTEEHDEE